MHTEEAGGAGPIPVLTLERAQHIGLLEAITRVLERKGHQSPVASRALVDLVDGEVHGKIVQADASTTNVTLHTIDGTIPQLRRALDRSLDAFFDLLPGAEADDVETFGD
jgi:hypothetical protein